MLLSFTHHKLIIYYCKVSLSIKVYIKELKTKIVPLFWLWNTLCLSANYLNIFCKQLIKNIIKK